MFHATLVSLLIGWQGRLRVASLSEISEFWFRLTLDASNAGVRGGSAPPAASRHKASEGWKHKAGSDVKQASASLGWLSLNGFRRNCWFWGPKVEFLFSFVRAQELESAIHPRWFPIPGWNGFFIAR